MAVDQATQALLDMMSGAFPDISTLEATQVRAMMEEAPAVPGPEVMSVIDRTIPGPAGEIPVRLYRPALGTLSTILYFHGGGWVIGSLNTHDAGCRALANATGSLVVSVDYRLAPEHVFPAAADDSYAATAWVAANAKELDIDPARLCVMGDSAGGNLAAVVALMARDQQGPAIALQVGLYPVIDADLTRHSYVENAEGFFLSTAMMGWFWDLYLSDKSARSNPYASPIRANDLSGLPQSHIITAEHDPLRDEGEAYANALREAGVTSTNTRYGGMFHGFFNMGAFLPAAAQAFDDVTSVIRTAFASEVTRPH